VAGRVWGLGGQGVSFAVKTHNSVIIALLAHITILVRMWHQLQIGSAEGCVRGPRR